jgi:hypothetical protein
MAPLARIEDLVVPSAKEREAIEVDFTYSTAKSPIVALDVVLETPLGSVHDLLPASLAGIEGPRGAGRLHLDLGAPPAGAGELTLTLVQADGKRGEPASASLEGPGSDGGPATLRGVSAVDETVTRPSGDDVVLARLDIAATGGERELVATWIRVRQPDGTETAAAAAPAPGKKDTVIFAAFGADHELGKYGIAVALLDAGGNPSETLETAVELVAEGGAEGPSIEASSRPRRPPAMRSSSAVADWTRRT